MTDLDKTIEKTEKVVLFKHVTSGGAIYYTDNHKFLDATSIIRVDGNEIEPIVFLGEKIKS